MKKSILVFWVWGFALTAFVCYERARYQTSHLRSRVPASVSLIQSQDSIQSWSAHNKTAE